MPGNIERRKTLLQWMQTIAKISSAIWLFGKRYPPQRRTRRSIPRSGKVRRHHVGDSAIQEMIKKAIKMAAIPKHGSVHTLRHSFATHLLMNGVNIREVQELLGHKNVETTMIYTHVMRSILCKIA